MKVAFKIIPCILLLSCIQVNAQYRNNYNTGGLDRSIGSETRYNEPHKKKPVDPVKMMTDNMTNKLELDGFQSAIVKTLIENYIQKTNDIALENIPNDAKIEKSNIERMNMENKFMEIFTDKQKILFNELIKENSGKKNKKKKNSSTAE
ncbi:hypothetical protein [Flavobacterium sp.]|uniref:hypothetical protein n=1 Tax=Flavobacterium sp. TaxID=239 RepID=UPI002601F70B|nr:hypothetical protein [Flavobacterium sp.]MDD3004403.1 hypothetical protein [Flavobacterium sp.]